MSVNFLLEKHYIHFYFLSLQYFRYLETFKGNFELLYHYFFVYFHPKNLCLLRFEYCSKTLIFIYSLENYFSKLYYDILFS